MFNEWKAIFKKPLFIIVMIGVSLIPALYNVIFLSSMWNPYGKVSELPVAVVNKDQHARFNSNTLSVGDDMVKSLKKNDALDFHFVSEAKAKKGLEKGDYYMIITLPSDLSQKAASILDNKPQKMQIDYQTSSGHSFIASKMSDSAMTRLQQTVANNVTNTYMTSLFKSMNKLRKGMTTAASGSGQLASGGQQLKEGSQTLTDNLQTLSSSSMTFADGANTLTTGLGTYTLGVRQLSDGIGTLSTRLSAYTSGVGQLASGSTTLSKGLTDYTNAVGQLADGSEQFSDGLSDYTNGVANLAGGANQLNDQSKNLLAGVNQLTASNEEIQKLSSGAHQLATGLNTLMATVKQSGMTAEQVQKLQALQTGLTAVQTALSTGSDLSAAKASMTTALNDMETTANMLVNSVATDKATITNNVAATAAYQKLSASEQAEINTAISQAPSQTSTAVTKMLTTIQALKAQVENLPDQSSNQQSIAVIEQAKGALSSLQTSAQQSQESILAALQQSTTGASQVAAGVDQLQRSLATGAGRLVKGVTDYTNGVAQITAGANTLSSHNEQLTSSMAKISSGSKVLASKNSQLTSGMAKVASGANQLAGNNGQIDAGLAKLAAGANQLVSNSAALVSGVGKLSDGAGKIADGSTKLADGSSMMTSNLGRLVSGVDALTAGLTDAKNQLSMVTTNKANAKALANPLTTKKIDKDHVGKNGIGMAPYMISVALFVAAISTNIIFNTLPSGKKPETRMEWLKARIQVNGVISLLAGLLVYGAVHMIGLTANHEWATLGIILLTSMCFMAVVTALVTWDTKLGAFTSLILLLLQLASSAGTYPLPLTDKIFQNINPWLPMSYSVSALRQTISITGQVGGQVAFMTVVLLLFVGLGFLVYNPNKKELV
ncbi:YhgE/Pip domain-containing protein [Streptococcus constellatus]|uniref:YhgE/Pip C-terminal domain protein n=1 Tax=Streptococcus constellatus subsp. constellatus SK53 TaxID=1095730 RepID=A0AAD2SUS4_STRCV|nr:YhgE/Pip domain-containing protein [Streptococcus constellatus]EID19428.1 YhgE/Pip C-terminal domain protein [Streptococcus constellatus subsp. constellatus SK53]MDP1485388.1 YhgE/Pip domain-containing protein [Streptococcus constellatus]QQT05140.1 YhgE/Pip domain-containing protein [Streptococcus constellatus]SUN41482.1 integral membrane protein [Streptococcus constellatus]BBD23539.1 YhgE/Pip C-terminal domain protein [Streptococcus constellatus subsp. constellatus]